MNNLKKLTRYSYVVAAIVATLTAVSIVLAWYTQTSNNGDFGSDEIKTISQGYAGHFSSYEEYNGNQSEIYENDENVLTQVSIIPGTVVYYAFMFDLLPNEGSIQGASYQITTLLLYGGDSYDYHDVTVGNYNSFLYNTGIEANSCHLFLMQKKYDSVDGNYYEQYGDSISVNSTQVARLSSTDDSDEEANVSMNLRITIPTISSLPTNFDNDEKTYFMLYIPIWYQDTEVNQNEEMSSYLKIVSTIVNAIN